MTSLRFYSEERLGNHQSLTPEGFLLVTDVPLARTGTLLYADGEVPVAPGPDGIIRVIRDPEEVFHPNAILSFAGKPVTNDHPPVKVDPDNWREFSVGVILHPRRGDGVQFDNDFLFADLLITDKDAIKDVRQGKREVSAGYDADYIQLGPGEGKQHQIIGNHVALVEKGRCGPRCSIGDKNMAGSARRKKPAWFDNVMKAARTGDESTLVDELEKVGEMLGDIHLLDEETVDRTTAVEDKKTKDDEGEGEGNAGILKRLDSLERAVAILAQAEEAESKDAKKATKDEDKEDEPDKSDKEEKKEDKSESKDAKAPAATKDDDKEDDKESDKEDKKDEKKESKDSKRAVVGDSSSLNATWQEVISRAEFLAPGVKLPTFDARAPAKTTFDAMCQFRRKVLTEAMKEDDTAAAIEQLVGPRPNLLQMTCDSVAVVYNGASELMRQANNHASTKSPGEGYNYHSSVNRSLTDTVKHINERNRAKYGVA